MQFFIHNTALKCYCMWYWHGSVYYVFLLYSSSQITSFREGGSGSQLQSSLSCDPGLFSPCGHLLYQHTPCMGKIKSPGKNPILVNRLIGGDTCAGEIWNTEQFRFGLLFYLRTAPIAPSFPVVGKRGRRRHVIMTWISCAWVCLHGRVSILIHHFSLLILHIPAHIPPLPVICFS